MPIQIQIQRQQQSAQALECTAGIPQSILCAVRGNPLCTVHSCQVILSTVQCAFIPGDLMQGVPPLCFCHAHFHLAPQYFTNINFKDFFQKNLLCVAGVIWLEEQTECQKYSMYVCSQQFDHGGVMCMTF